MSHLHLLSRQRREKNELTMKLIDQQDALMTNFQTAMAKLAIVGQDTSSFIDCSEVIPDPVPAVGKDTTYVFNCIFRVLSLIQLFFLRYPATKSFADIQQVCPSPFPTLATDRKFLTHNLFLNAILIANNSWCCHCDPQLRPRWFGLQLNAKC